MWRNRYAFVGYSTLELLLRFAFVASAKQSTVDGARAPVCVLPFASKRDYLRARQREPTFVYVLIDGGSCSTAARQCDYLDSHPSRLL